MGQALSAGRDRVLQRILAQIREQQSELHAVRQEGISLSPQTGGNNGGGTEV